MIRRFHLVLGLLTLSSQALAGLDSYYCPENHGYINLGMTPAQVKSACGEPLSKQQSNRPIMQRVPVQELIFNNMGTKKVFYGVWAIPTGTNGGSRLQVNIIDNKVKSVEIGGSDSNAFSICNGVSLQVGDPVSKVYASCGNPSIVNNTFVNQPLQSNAKTLIWIFQPSQYESPITLTFVNGKLQSID